MELRDIALGHYRMFHQGRLRERLSVAIHYPLTAIRYTLYAIMVRYSPNLAPHQGQNDHLAETGSLHF